MAFDGRWTGVREHTRFVGKCAEPTRQSWSKSSSLASLSVRQLLQTCVPEHTKQHKQTQTNTSSHTVRLCVQAFWTCSISMCGWLVVIFSVRRRSHHANLIEEDPPKSESKARLPDFFCEYRPQIQQCVARKITQLLQHLGCSLVETNVDLREHHSRPHHLSISST